MADILPDLMLDAYAQAILDGLTKEEERKGGPLPSLGFVRYFDLALSSALGDLDDRRDGFDEAWRTVLLLRSILPGGLTAFAKCMLDALDQGRRNPDAPKIRPARQSADQVRRGLDQPEGESWGPSEGDRSWKALACR